MNKSKIALMLSLTMFFTGQVGQIGAIFQNPPLIAQAIQQDELSKLVKFIDFTIDAPAGGTTLTINIDKENNKDYFRASETKVSNVKTQIDGKDASVTSTVDGFSIKLDGVTQAGIYVVTFDTLDDAGKVIGKHKISFDVETEARVITFKPTITGLDAEGLHVNLSKSGLPQNTTATLFIREVGGTAPLTSKSNVASNATKVTLPIFSNNTCQLEAGKQYELVYQLPGKEEVALISVVEQADKSVTQILVVTAEIGEEAVAGGEIGDGKDRYILYPKVSEKEVKEKLTNGQEIVYSVNYVGKDTNEGKSNAGPDVNLTFNDSKTEVSLTYENGTAKLDEGYIPNKSYEGLEEYIPEGETTAWDADSTTSLFKGNLLAGDVSLSFLDKEDVVVADGGIVGLPTNYTINYLYSQGIDSTTLSVADFIDVSKPTTMSLIDVTLFQNVEGINASNIEEWDNPSTIKFTLPELTHGVQVEEITIKYDSSEEIDVTKLNNTIDSNNSFIASIDGSITDAVLMNKELIDGFYGGDSSVTLQKINDTHNNTGNNGKYGLILEDDFSGLDSNAIQTGDALKIHNKFNKLEDKDLTLSEIKVPVFFKVDALDAELVSDSTATIKSVSEFVESTDKDTFTTIKYDKDSKGNQFVHMTTEFGRTGVYVNSIKSLLVKDGEEISPALSIPDTLVGNVFGLYHKELKYDVNYELNAKVGDNNYVTSFRTTEEPGLKIAAKDSTIKVGDEQKLTWSDTAVETNGVQINDEDIKEVRLNIYGKDGVLQAFRNLEVDKTTGEYIIEPALEEGDYTYTITYIVDIGTNERAEFTSNEAKIKITTEDIENPDETVLAVKPSTISNVVVGNDVKLTWELTGDDAEEAGKIVKSVKVTVKDKDGKEVDTEEITEAPFTEHTVSKDKLTTAGDYTFEVEYTFTDETVTATKGEGKFTVTTEAEVPAEDLTIKVATISPVVVGNPVNINWTLETAEGVEDPEVESATVKVTFSDGTVKEYTAASPDFNKVTIPAEDAKVGVHNFEVSYTFKTEGATVTPAKGSFEVKAKEDEAAKTNMIITLDRYDVGTTTATLRWNWTNSSTLNATDVESDDIKAVAIQYRRRGSNENWYSTNAASALGSASNYTNLAGLYSGTEYEYKVIYTVERAESENKPAITRTNVESSLGTFRTNYVSTDYPNGGGTIGGGSSSGSTTTNPGSVVVTPSTSNSTTVGNTASVTLPSSVKPNTSVTPSLGKITFTNKEGKEEESKSIDYRNVKAYYDSNGRLVVEGLVPGKPYKNIIVNVTNQNGTTTQVTLKDLNLTASTELEKYMVNVYDFALSRYADEDGYNFHNSQLKNKTTNLREFVLNILNEKEFIELRETPEKVITRLYKVIVDRDAEDAGLTFWIDEYNSLTKVLGSTEAAKKAVAERMVNEPELKEIAEKKLNVNW